MTTSPPSSIHLIGAATKLLTGTPWVADIRDSLVANHDRQVERPLVRLRERSHRRVARLVARRADGVVAVTPTIAEEQRALGARGPIAVIPNGADFDDFAGLRYSPASRFRITHTGSFFAGRSPRAFLQALQESRLDVAARFVGGFRQVDLAWTEERGLGSRIELVPGATHAETLALQRDSEALLLLLPDAGPRGLDVPSGKLFEYLAAERPILAAVPPDGTAARLVREAGAGIVVSPDDVPGMARALATLHERWQADPTALRPLPADFRARIDRVERVRELAAFLTKVT
jgi:glycosyltransferase involved in cell wall biosynthesis